MVIKDSIEVQSYVSLQYAHEADDHNNYDIKLVRNDCNDKRISLVIRRNTSTRAIKEVCDKCLVQSMCITTVIFNGKKLPLLDSACQEFIDAQTRIKEETKWGCIMERNQD